MNCDACQDRLLEFASESLAPAEAELVRAHLTGCVQCRGMLDELQEAFATLALTASPVAPPAELKQELLTRIHADLDGPRAEVASRATRATVWRTVLPYIAVSLCAVLAGVIAVSVADRRVERQEMLAKQFHERMDASRRAFPSSRMRFASHGPSAPSDEVTFYLILDNAAGEVHFHALNLVQPAAGKHLELWLESVQGEPVHLGRLEPDASGTCSASFPLRAPNLEVARAIVTEEATTGARPTGPEKVSAVFGNAAQP